MKEKTRWKALIEWFSSPKTTEEPQQENRGESPEAGPPEKTLPPWKEQAMADFSAWLEELPESPPAAEAATTDTCDLYTLLSEFSALRQEIKLQNREQHRGIKTFSDTAEAFQKGLSLFEKSAAGIDQLEGRIRETAEKNALLPFLDVRDALVRGHKAARAAAGKRRPLRRSRRRSEEAILEGYDMAIRRLDRALFQAGITPIEAEGGPFDPGTMKAIQTRSEPEKPSNTVLEEQAGGFLKNDTLLRPAEVVVNKPE
jgi:molecular chaperone GrpE (heat shock protein)